MVKKGNADPDLSLFDEALHFAKPQDLPGVQNPCLNRVPVDVCAISRATISDPKLVAAKGDFAVKPRYGRIVDWEIAIGISANPVHP
jgi:hypothetical protein